MTALDAYRVTWYDERGPHHSDRLTLTEADRRFAEVCSAPGCYAVHELTEDQFRQWVGDIARRALGAE